MHRRELLGAGCLAGVTALAAMAEGARAAGAPKKQFLELRLYRLDAGAMRQRFEAFLTEAAIPAWNRAGIKPVGVFSPTEPKSDDLYVLLPYDSLDTFAAARGQLLADAAYQKAGAAAIDAPKDAPAYKRIESALMIAFDGVPKVEVPTKKDSRVFQLRTYESHSDLKAIKKIEMFNTGGELAVFRRTGMNPVFFGETLVGTKLPNLTYMLGFDDADAQKKAWDAFLKHPEWEKLKADPAYKDTVSAITNIVLRPAGCSQI